MKKIYIYIFIIIALLILGYFFGAKLAAILGGAAAMFGVGHKKKINKVKSQAAKEKETANDIKENIEKRKKKDEKLSNKMKNYFNILLIFILILSFPGGLLADDQPPPEFSIDNLKIPSDYDTLLDYYKNMAMIAIEYQQMYREAETDNEKLLESNNKLQKLIDTQQEIINSLMKKRLGVFTGVNYVPMKPANTGVIVGVDYQF